MVDCYDTDRIELSADTAGVLTMSLTLTRYIILSILRGFFLVGLILVALFSLILLIEELDEVGTGNYSVWLALQYVLLHVPQLVSDFSTVISLIGAVIALGALVNNNELVAINSLGGSSRRVILSVLSAAVLLMGLVFLLAQYVTPHTSQEARVIRALALSEQGDSINTAGYWAQKDRRFLHIKEILFGRIPANVEIFEFDDHHQLQTYILAEQVDIQEDDVWVLKNVSISTMTEAGMHTQQLDRWTWKSFLDASQLGIIVAEPQSLSITDLHRYIQGLKERDAQSYHFEIMFWQKLLTPIAGITMILLGMLFVFGSQRVMSASQRTILGILAGIGFYIYTQIVTHFGVSQLWGAGYVAGIPSATALLLICLIYLSRRAR